jgi:xanthine/uracil permease
MTAVPTLAYALLVASVCGLTPGATQSLVAGTLLGMGLCTALNAWGGRIGSGALFINIPNFDFMFIGPAAVAAAGSAGLAGEALIAAIACFLLRPLLPRLRSVLSPAVVGSVVCMAGVSLAAPAFKTAVGIEGPKSIDPVSAFVSLGSLLTIVGLSVWGGRRLVVMAVVSGIFVGDAIAASFGRMNLPPDLALQPWIGGPAVVMPTLHLPVAVMFGAVLISLLGQVYNVGCSVIMEKQTDADWRRPDMLSASRVLTANAIGDSISAFLGGIATCVGSANLALATASKAVSRYIGLLVAFFLVGLAFLPKVVAFLTFLLPGPVQGAFQVYTALFLFVGGAELAMARAPSTRTTFILGLSVCVGLAVTEVQGLSEHVPNGLKIILSSGYLIAGIVALGLNVIFRLGTKRTAEEKLVQAGRRPLEIVAGFLETRGGEWGVRRDVLQRAILAAKEAAECIAASEGRDLLSISGRFDEFNFDVILMHSGAALALSEGAATPEMMQNVFSEANNDVAIDAVMWRASSALLRHLADRVSTGPLDSATGNACVRLHFDH